MKGKSLASIGERMEQAAHEFIVNKLNEFEKMGYITPYQRDLIIEEELKKMESKIVPN
ncbi:hypothetical protein ACQUWN_22985 [Rossellomorea aquimaris]|uniref:hypothetical protein n=1 Tax=Rossellomorea TaxID=2837508 RepID=UPI001653811D|nr:hypothetical protein [Rossellomorea vietnamensis]